MRGLGLGFVDMYDGGSDRGHGGGLSDLAVGAKRRFYRNGDIYLLAVGHGIGMQKYSPEGHLIWTHAPLDTGDRMTACALDGDVVYVAGPAVRNARCADGVPLREGCFFDRARSTVRSANGTE